MTTFASANDEREQVATLVELAPGAFGFVSDYDPNCGFVVGDDSVLVIDTRATPAMARQLQAAIRSVTDKPVRRLFLTHYHAVRVLGAAAFAPEVTVIASEGTRQWIAQRGQADYDSELGRFPRLFKGHEEIPGLTRPHITFADRLSVWLGSLEVQLIHIGRGHSRGDSIAWVPSLGVMYAGDLVENRCAVYAGAEMRLARGRPMKPYEEAWMDRIDTMRTIFGWGDESVTHFHELAIRSEQIVMTVRWGNWGDRDATADTAANWARLMRNVVQRYVHAYRAVTGVDLTLGVDTTMPALLLARRGRARAQA